LLAGTCQSKILYDSKCSEMLKTRLKHFMAIGYKKRRAAGPETETGRGTGRVTVWRDKRWY